MGESSGVDKTTYFPKPLNNNVVGAVAILVPGVLPPIIHIHIPQTTHQQLRRTNETRWSSIRKGPH